jgi:competence protein ComEC
VCAFAAALAASAAGARDRILAAPLVRVAEGGAGGTSDAQATARVAVPVPVRGVLVEDAAPSPAGVRLLIDATELFDGSGWAPVNGRLQTYVAGTLAAPNIASWTRGRRIEAPVVLRRLHPWRNPGGPDPDRQALRRGFVVAGTIKSAALVEVAPGSRWQEAAAAVRGYVRRQTARWIAPIDPLSAAVTTAILIGDRAGLPEDVTRRLQVAGTYHVIAISGGNVALVAIIALGVARLIVRPLRARLLAALGIVAAYGWLVGGDPSVSRAVTAACVYLACRGAGLRPAPMDVLGLVILMLLPADPLLVIDVGAWLSFGAALGILVVAGRLAAWLMRSLGGTVSRAGPAARVPIALLSATVAAELILLPVNASVFGRVGAAGLMLNFIAIPAMALVQMAGFGLLLAGSWWEGAAQATAWGAHLAVGALVRSAELVDVAPWLSWRVAPPGMVWIAIFYLAGVLAFASSLTPSRRNCVAATALLSGIVIVTAPWLGRAAPARGWLRATMLDVGQGEALVVQFPSGQSLLVDAGGVPGAFDVGGRVVVPALRALGVRRLDWLAFTHADLDHAGGAVAVAEALEPHEIWEGTPVPRDVRRQALYAHAAARGVAWRHLQRGDVLIVGAVELAVLHPPPPDWERQRVRNDDSLVLRLRYGSVELLLTGDISRAIEHALIAEASDRSRFRILKVAHHGSRTSTSAEWLYAAGPHLALISAGRNNLFGHPAPEVTRRLTASGATIYRTDRLGAIQVETDGRQLRVQSMEGRPRWFSLWPWPGGGEAAGPPPHAGGAAPAP